MTQSERIWYLYTSDGSQGPYTPEEILAWRDAGQISDEWSVWREGYAEWLPLGSATDLAPAPAPAPLAPPAASAYAPPTAVAQPASPVRLQERPTRAPAPAAAMNRPQPKAHTSNVSVAQGAGIGGIIIMVIAGAIGRTAGREAVTMACRSAPALGAPVEFASRTGKYTLKIPSSHKVESQQVALPPPLNGKKAEMNVATNDNSPYAFFSSHFDVPAGAAFDLDNGVQGYVSNIQGKVRTQKTVTYRGYAGREFTFEGKAEGHDISGLARVFVIKRRVVILSFMKEGSDANDPPEAKAFLESFSYSGPL